MIDPEVIARIAERKIQEAIDEGKFDNLPGKGRPIVFEDDPGVPLHIRMANKVFKNAGALPDWMMVQNDIVSESKEAAAQRARLIREGYARRARLHSLPATHPKVAGFVEWHTRSRVAYLRRLKNVNTAILKFTMMAPSTAPAYPSYKIDREMAEFDQAFPTLEQAKNLPPPTVESESKLRNIARERYQQGGGEVRGWAKTAGKLGLGRGGGDGMDSGMDHEDIKRADIPDTYKQNP
jgi:DnaJ family protein C protein 28